MNNETRKKSTEFKVWGAMNIVIEIHMHDSDSIDSDDSCDCFWSYKIHDLENIKEWQRTQQTRK